MTDTVNGVADAAARPTRAGSLVAVVRRMWRVSRRTCDLYERLARRTSIPVLRRHYGWYGEDVHARGDELVALLAELDDSGPAAGCSPCTRRHGGAAKATEDPWRARDPLDVLSHEIALLGELAHLEELHHSDWPALVASAGGAPDAPPATDAEARVRRLAAAVTADGSARRSWTASARRRLELIRANGVTDADELADHVRNAFG